MLADAGHWSESKARLEDERTELFITTTRDWKPRQAHRAPQADPQDRHSQGAEEPEFADQVWQEGYKPRGATIEAVFGQMVMRHLVRFWLREIAKVNGEWLLSCTSHNILKLWRAGLVLKPAC